MPNRILRKYFTFFGSYFQLMYFCVSLIFKILHQCAGYTAFKDVEDGT